MPQENLLLADRSARLAKLGMRYFEKDLRLWSRAELADEFASARSGRIKLAPLFRNLLWQVHGRIARGEEPPVWGNIRTGWYRWAKPVLAHFDDDDALRTDPYDLFVRELRDLVVEHQVMRYQDFDFTDENFASRQVGTQRPAVLVFAEKAGALRLLEQVHLELGVSTLALGGTPSALTSEYTAIALVEAMGGVGPVELVGIVDYDPSGFIIARAFQAQLAALGLPESRLHWVVRLSDYTPQEQALYRYPLSLRQRAEVEAWVEETGGVEGEAFGLEVEAMPLERLRARVFKVVEGVLAQKEASGEVQE